ncbi:MAG: tripartite tricarboxylate transporter substrate-binding protein [Pigmentiphaga sp.]|nr:tripartite tricarboxylate transporter substrate-binding protein [Pigmentiphaga sp.]
MILGKRTNAVFGSSPDRLRRALAIAVASSALALGASTTYAQEATRLIVPFPPGGGTDTIARSVAQTLSDGLGYPVVVDNRAGAGGIIGASALLQAPPDGKTLFLSSNSVFTINPAVRPDMPYDPNASFQGLAILGTAPLCLLVRSDAPWADLAALLTTAKQEPGKLTYASFGPGSVAHFAGALLADEAGIELLHVPYKGSAPAMQDLLGGRVDMSFDTVTASLPQIAANRVRCLGVTSNTRFEALPDTPTLDAAGVPGYHFTTWVAVVAKAGTPANVLGPLQAALKNALAQPALASRLASLGLATAGASELNFEALLAEEIPRYQDIASRAAIRID